MSNASVSYTKYYNGSSWIDPGNVSGPYAYGYGTNRYLFGILCTVTINVSTGYTLNSTTFSIPRILGTGSSSQSGVKIHAFLYKSDPQSSFSGPSVPTSWKSGSSSSVTITSSSISGTVTVSSLGITSSGTYYLFLTTDATSTSKPIIYQVLQSDQITCSVSHTKNPTPATSVTVASSINMNVSTTISWSPTTSGYYYQLYYKFVGDSSWQAIGSRVSSSSKSWTPPTSLSSQIPNSVSGTLKFKLESYAASTGGTPYGSCETQCTLSIPTSGRNPTGDTNWYGFACSKLANVYIIGRSDLTAKVNASLIHPKYNATISSIVITRNGSTVNASKTSTSLTSYSMGKVVAGTTTNQMTITVTDSRGFKLTKSSDAYEGTAYTPPSFTSLTVKRVTSGGTASTSGKYYKVLPVVTYSAIGNNTLTLTAYYKKVSASSYTSSGAVTNNTTSGALGDGNILTTDSYNIRVTASDSVTTTALEQIRTLPNTSVAATFNLKANGLGAAFFGLADTDNTLQVKGALSAQSMSLTTPLPIASGGTAATSAVDACKNLKALHLSANGTSIPANSNLDDYTTAGNYYVGSGSVAVDITNTPVTSAGYKLTVICASSSSYVRQIAIVNNTSDIYIRAKKASAWSAWGCLLDTTSLPISVANGGTGATTPAAARTALGVVNYTSPTLLWTNSAIQNAFAGQKVTLSLSSYNFVLIEFAAGPYNGSLQTMLVAKSMPSAPSGYADPDYKLLGITQSGAACRMCYRSFTVSATGVTFDGGVWVDNYGGTNTSNNNYCKPSRIWGIK